MHKQTVNLIYSHVVKNMTRKMVPITGRGGHFSYFWSFQEHNREEGGTE